MFCNIKKKKDLIKSLYFLTKYDASKVPGLYFYRTNKLKITINNKDRKSWGIDGEKLDDDGVIFDIKNTCDIKVMMPKKNIEKLFV